jgi:hypothetical protein
VTIEHVVAERLLEFVWKSVSVCGWEGV